MNETEARIIEIEIAIVAVKKARAAVDHINEESERVSSVKLQLQNACCDLGTMKMRLQDLCPPFTPNC